MQKLTQYLGVIILLFITTNIKAQDYDIGVFYMPWWHDGDPVPSTPEKDPYTHQSQTVHHWSIIDDYNDYLISQNKASEIRKPLGLYYQAGTGAYYGPSNWYNENLKGVTEKQLEIMSNYGIDFVIYNAYWSHNASHQGSVSHRVIDNWLPNNGHAPHNPDPSTSPLNNHGVKMALMWTHDLDMLNDGSQAYLCGSFFNSGGGLDQMISYWAQYMALDTYKTTQDGRPIFYIYNGININNILLTCGADSFFSGVSADPYVAQYQRVAHLINYINSKFKQILNIDKDIYFVSVVNTRGDQTSYNSKWNWLLRWPDEGGFDAHTTLRYDVYDSYDKTQYSGSPANYPNFNYTRMTEIYAEYYNYMLNNNFNNYPNTNIDYQIPVSPGWNKAPFHFRGCFDNNPDTDCGNPSFDYKISAQDNRESTPTTFKAALQQAKNWADAYPNRTKKRIVIYAWNEHAEGTVIEPTVRWGYQYLQAIKDVFHPELIPPGGGNGNTGDGPFDDAIPEASKTGSLIPTISESFIINQIQPNPVNDLTKVTYSIPSKALIRASITDSNGSNLESLLNEVRTAGIHELNYSFKDKPNGVYIIRIEYKNESKTIKVVVKH